ncbi:MAG: hypothetical protein ACR2QK_17200 [Acidimicrobiales bacterium]
MVDTVPPAGQHRIESAAIAVAPVCRSAAAACVDRFCRVEQVADHQR